jgi:aminopeptidase N
LDFHVLGRDRPAAEHDLANTCAMMDFLTGRLGPYPFAGEKYAQVEVIWGGAMEHTTATSLGQFMFTGDRRYENVVLHELAHQWFGDSLTPAVWADIWLNEGFATYAEALWLEHTQAPGVAQAFLHLIGPGRHPGRFAGEGTLSDPSPVLPNTLVYDKGAWVLHMLRGVIGDEAFFRFLRDYANDPGLAQGLVTTAEMISHAEAAAGRDLDAFFTPWLETDAVPQVRLEPVPDNTRPGRAAVRARQLQPTLMTVPLPLLIQGGRCSLPVTAVLEQREQTFTWELDCPIDSVTVDPGRASLVLWAEAPQPAFEVRGPVPNPFRASHVEFTLILNNDTQVTVNIYDARGRLVDQVDLGTLPGTGVGGNGHLWRWTPPSGAGAPPAGACWFEFRAGDDRAVRRGMLIK